MNLFGVAAEIVFYYVATAPRVDFATGTRVNVPGIRCDGGDVFRMQTTHANQSKMVAAVHVKRTADTGCDHIVLTIVCETNGGRHFVADVTQGTAALE